MNECWGNRYIYLSEGEKKKKESGWNLQTNKKKGKSWGNMEKLLQELKTKANSINWLIKKM